MRLISLLILAMFATALHAAEKQAMVIDHRCIDAGDKIIPQAALDKARRLNIVFGHESVGWNVVNGLEELGRANPQRYRLEIGHMIQADWYRRSSGLGEFFVANAGNVPAKGEAFADRLASGVAEQVSVASLKLCWADFRPNTDVDAAFKQYTGTMETLARKYPKITFVYWSLPLRKEPMLQEKRTAFNKLMADYVKTHPIVLFDIADIESHKPDGGEYRNETRELALFPDYTDDGGHLNAAGRERAARAWWWLTARLAGWDGKPAK